MLTAHGRIEAGALKHKARSIELQAARAAPMLAAQLRCLAAQYYADADVLIAALHTADEGVQGRHLGNRFVALSLNR